jgi:homoisocitrate dehydrogenase
VPFDRVGFMDEFFSQAARKTLEALGSDLPKLEFHNLLAGFDLFTRTGTALPRETVE